MDKNPLKATEYELLEAFQIGFESTNHEFKNLFFRFAERDFTKIDRKRTLEVVSEHNIHKSA